MGMNIWTGMTDTAKKHMRAICSDAVEKTNVIGLRKVFNHQARIDAGLSGNRCNVTPEEVEQLDRALGERQPRVVGELHDTGVAVLRNRRYRSKFNSEQLSIIENLECFRLIGFQFHDRYHLTPVYRVIAKDGRKFSFTNVPWQSGGNGPEVQ